MLRVDNDRQRLAVGLLAQVPAGRPGELPVAGHVAGLGHAGEAEVGRVGEHGREHDPPVVGGQVRAQVGEAAAEAGPSIDLCEQLGDAHSGEQAIEPLRQVFGGFRCNGLERGDTQVGAGDPDVFQAVLRGGRLHPIEAPLELRLALLEYAAHISRHGHRQGSGSGHRLELRSGDQLILNGTELPTALDPDIARAQALPELGKDG